MKRTTRVLALLTVSALVGSGVALTRDPAPAAASATDATIYLLSSSGAGNGTITTVHSSTPGSAVGSPLALGVPGGETPVALDVRPANRTPYILTTSGSNLTLYSVNLSGGGLTAVVSVFTPGVPTFHFASGPTNGIGLDFDPAGDLARIVDRAGDNGYVDMSDGSFHENSALATTNVRGIAYDRSYSGTSASTLFGITDNNGTAAAHLLRIGAVDGAISPNGGSTADLGSMGPTTAAGQQDLDIAPDGTGFALLNSGGTTRLYSVDLGSGVANSLGATTSGAFALGVAPPASTISIAPGTGSFSVPSNDTVATFTIVRTGGVGTVTIGFHTLDGTALAGRDYVPMLGSIFWTGADTDPKTIQVPISGGRNGQGRSFSLVLSDPSGGASLAASTSTVTFGPPKEGGYWLAASDGGVFTFGGAPLLGSTADIRLNQPVVGIASTPNENGYWLVAADGGIFSFGDARWFGSTGDLRLAKPIVGMARTPDGGGYWLVASDGGVFTFGDAAFYGSAGAIALTKPIVGMAPTPSGHGYWLVASDGGIFTFGDAGFAGSAGALPLVKPVVGMATTKAGHGYWLVASDGGIFTFGDAPFLGSAGALPLVKPIVAMTPTPKGDGYWLTASDGGIFTFGAAIFSGSTGGIKLNRPVVGITAR